MVLKASLAQNLARRPGMPRDITAVLRLSLDPSGVFPVQRTSIAANAGYSSSDSIWPKFSAVGRPRAAHTYTSDSRSGSWHTITRSSIVAYYIAATTVPSRIGPSVSNLVSFSSGRRHTRSTEILDMTTRNSPALKINLAERGLCHDRFLRS